MADFDVKNPKNSNELENKKISNVDVSKTACDERIEKRKQREIKINKVFSLVFAFGTLITFVCSIVGLILAIVGTSKWSFPIISFVCCIVCLTFFGMLNNENNKLSKMSSTDYSSQKLDELTFEDNDVISCPSCHNEQLSYNKKGFGVGKALVGVTLFGLWGTLGGTIGQDEIYATCLKCGKKFKVRKK